MRDRSQSDGGSDGDGSAGGSGPGDRTGGGGSGASGGQSVLSLPSGGGAIGGTGGNFATSLQTGDGTHSIDVEVPEGRNGLQPSPTLSYSTGNGHGIAGMGWSLGLAAITRSTKRGVPTYDPDADTFVVPGGGQLVPVGEWTAAETTVTQYRGRSETAFDRLTRHRGPHTDHWVVEATDGSVKYFGTPDRRGDDPGAVADPDADDDVFAWYLTAREDEFGNRIEYDYARNGGRSEAHAWVDHRLAGIRYVDYYPASDGEQSPAEPSFLVSIAFEYADRPDPISSYVAGFEERTSKRLDAIAVRSHADEDRTVRRYELTYRDELADEPANGTSQLARVQVVGHDDGDTERAPPSAFEYADFDPGVRSFEALSGPLPRRSLGAPERSLADLTGDGLPDLVEIDDDVRFWRNLGDGEFDDPQAMASAPAGLSLADPDVQLLDADGNGRLDLVSLGDDLTGYFPLDRSGAWARDGFQAYDTRPNVDFADPNVRLMDLDGDGVTDALRASTDLECFFQDAEEGWTTTRTVAGGLDDVEHLDLADDRVRFGDCTGDGMQDVVLVDAGHVSYWPNHGRGEWGRRVTMQNPPDLPADYDPDRLLLGDVDGDGVTDAVYVENDRVTFWLNRCGNDWTDPVVVDGTPPVTDATAVQLADVYGTGVGGVLYSGLGADGDDAYFLDVTGGQKPYLLVETRNNMGAETRVDYEPSTTFARRDADAGDPWQTTLPSPTWVVSRVESIDHLAESRQVTELDYHHGHYDGAEREFRGFGLVEQRDSETFADYDAAVTNGSTADAASRVPEESFAPPTLKKTWFHVGPVGPAHGDWQTPAFDDEFWPGDPGVLDRPPGTRDRLAALDRRDERDALRALAGNTRRTEVYALDDSPRENRPYEVTEHRYAIDALERSTRATGPRAMRSRRAFSPRPYATRTSTWDRGSDPKTQLTVVPEYDDYGQPTRQVAITCPRGYDPGSGAAASGYDATWTTTTYVTDDATAEPSRANATDRYVVDRVERRATYAVVDEHSRTIRELLDAIASGAATNRLTGLTRHYYDGPAFEGKPLGELGEYGARVRTEELVLTDELVARAYGAADSPGDTPPYLTDADPTWASEYPDGFQATLPAHAGYVVDDVEAATDVTGATTGYFAPTEQVAYGFQRTPPERSPDRGDVAPGVLVVERDALGNESTVDRWDDYDYVALAVSSPTGLQTTATYDYAAMAYVQRTDANGNRSRVRFSPLGHVTASMELGKQRVREGDTRTEPSVSYEYDLHAYAECPPDDPQPPYVHEVERKRHRWTTVDDRNDARAAAGEAPLSDSEERALFDDERDRHPERFVQRRTYFDGAGQDLQVRSQAPSRVFADADGDAVLPADGDVDPHPDGVRGTSRATDDPRVRVTGWQTYDNKGNVVEAYEPCFDRGWAYLDRRRAAVETPGRGAGDGDGDGTHRRTTIHYDGLGQAERVVRPDGSEQRIVRGDPSPNLADPSTYDPTPWEQYVYDPVDNAGRTHPDNSREYAHRWNTPSSTSRSVVDDARTLTERNRRPGETTPGEIEQSETTVTRDPRTNTVTTTDALGRTSQRVLLDLTGSPIRVDAPDDGTSWTLRDAAGTVRENRDAKGAIELQGTTDGRPSKTWARDDDDGAVTLRERIAYADAVADANAAGNGSADGIPDRDAARDRNLLGSVYRAYDESGRSTIVARDFRGEPVETERTLVADDVVSGGPVDWTPRTDGETYRQRASALLGDRSYETTVERDAVGRLRVRRFPDAVDGTTRELHVDYTPAGGVDTVDLVEDPGGSNERRESYVEAVGRDARDRPVLTAYGNGVLSRSAYDDDSDRLARQRLETCTTTRTANDRGPFDADAVDVSPDGTVYRDVAVTHDQGGKILETRNDAPGAGVANAPQGRHGVGASAPGRDTLVSSFAYDAVGRLVRATGRECTSISQPRGWSDATRCGHDATPGGTPSITRRNAPDQTGAYTETYSYDSAGNLTELTHTHHAPGGPQQWSRHFGYDGERPVDWTPSSGNAPGNASGNARGNASGNDPTAGAAGTGTGTGTGSNRLTHVGDEDPTIAAPTHEYDATGNLRRERNSEYEWDHRDRLATYREAAGGTVSVEASYAYSAGGQRAKKVVDKGDNRREVIEYVGGVFEYHRLETDRTSDDGGTVRENDAIEIAGVARKRVGTPFDEPTTFADSDRPSVRYTMGDPTGSESMVVDGDGDWVNTEEYTPFGETTFGGYARKRYRYMNSERDEESGLYYQGARYYAPWLCRWTTTDPAGPQDGPNRYAYVDGDPVNYSDPTGTQSQGSENEDSCTVWVDAGTGTKLHGPGCNGTEDLSETSANQSESTNGDQSTQRTQEPKESASTRSSGPSPTEHMDQMTETASKAGQSIEKSNSGDATEAAMQSATPARGIHGDAPSGSVPSTSLEDELSRTTSSQRDSGGASSDAQSSGSSSDGGKPGVNYSPLQPGDASDGGGGSGDDGSGGFSPGAVASNSSNAMTVTDLSWTIAQQSRSIRWWQRAHSTSHSGWSTSWGTASSTASSASKGGFSARALNALKNPGASLKAGAGSLKAGLVGNIGPIVNHAGGFFTGLAHGFNSGLSGSNKQGAAAGLVGVTVTGIGATSMGPALAVAGVCDITTGYATGWKSNTGFIGSIGYATDVALSNPVERSEIASKALNGDYGAISNVAEQFRQRPVNTLKRSGEGMVHMWDNVVVPSAQFVTPGW